VAHLEIAKGVVYVSHKKSPQKKSKLLSKVHPDTCFVLLGGKKINTVPELALEIDVMPDEVFYHHVNDVRNDFANWIRDVIGDIELAKAVLGTVNRKDAEIVLLRHIVRNIR
jgi:hypothetical protein